VASSSLQAESPLKGYDKRFADTSRSEPTALSIYSISLALQANVAMASIEKSLGAQWPQTGQSTLSGNGTYRLLGLQSDQVFALVASETPHVGLPELKADAYITDQSDSWAGLELNGPMARRALERVCPIDLHPSVFPADQVTRTSMEHLAVIILCKAENSYLLLSPTSSAQSFLHAIETSLHNVHE